MTKGYWKPQMKSGSPYDEVNSGIQKMIRRGKEREALILAQEMFDSGFHSAISRRLMVIACEDRRAGSRKPHSEKASHDWLAHAY